MSHIFWKHFGLNAEDFLGGFREDSRQKSYFLMGFLLGFLLDIFGVFLMGISITFRAAFG
jgi:hypothetical protein